ncbi:uncharacterized protein LOC111000647 [Pieris rapae]|uniref:uncharacterized protein LOC111000647 n=1 Tax=Pieris rapae TaxID=64459 RepID=UPI001E27FAD0|nr:uncharacterized protein LOC111000647 [Pieris rapae]
MGKLAYYTDSDETEDTSSSADIVKKKKRSSILKYSGGSLRKKKCKLHSKSEPDETECRSKSNQGIAHKLRGILKHTEHESTASDDEESASSRVFTGRDRCLVGRVPRPPGSKPGRGGGVAIVVRKNISNLQPQKSTSSTKKRRAKRLLRKQSY